MATPFDQVSTTDFAPAGQEFAKPITPAQRRALREMMLEKAELRGLDLQQADDVLDEWFKDMTLADASKWIRHTGQWLDTERANRGIARPASRRARTV